MESQVLNPATHDFSELSHPTTINKAIGQKLYRLPVSALG